jgi:MFS family permease
MGLEYNMQLIMSGVLNCVQLVGVLSSLWTMDAIGRRPLLLCGSAVMFLSHLVISVLVGKFSHDWPAYRPEGWASVGMLLVYMLAFGASWVSDLIRRWVDQIYVNQQLTNFDRAPCRGQCPPKSSPLVSVLKASRKHSPNRPQILHYLAQLTHQSSLSTCSNWLFNFLIGLLTPPLVESTGYGAYVFFAVFCLLSLVWVYWFVPETAGKTLEEMDRVFRDLRAGGEEERRRRIEVGIAEGMERG